MGEQGIGSVDWDPRRVLGGERDFWEALWLAPHPEVRGEMGADQVGFGPIQAFCLAEEPAQVGLNFALGAGEENAVEHGHLADAVAWLESRRSGWSGERVDFRVPLVPSLPNSAAAEAWLREHGAQRVDGVAKLVRDASPPRFSQPVGIEALDWNEWDEGFGAPLAEGLGLPHAAGHFFLCLLGEEGWHCYCAVEGDAPLAYAAMRMHSGVASLAIASRPAEGRDGEGQLAVLRRCIEDARAAGCDTLAAVDAGQEPPVADRGSLVEAGFEVAYRSSAWCSYDRVPA